MRDGRIFGRAGPSSNSRDQWPYTEGEMEFGSGRVWLLWKSVVVESSPCIFLQDYKLSGITRLQETAHCLRWYVISLVL